MKGVVEERAVELGEYILENKETVRAAARKFGISKSTVHKDVSQRLKKLNPALYSEVKKILDINKSQRHIRGGLATKNKYLKLPRLVISTKFLHRRFSHTLFLKIYLFIGWTGSLLLHAGFL